MTASESTSRLADITDGLKKLSSSQLELAKAEITPAVKHAAIGGGMFGGAGAFAMHALWMLLIGAALAVGLAFDQFTSLTTWPAFVLGFVTVGIASLLIAGILALLGRSQFRRVKKPEATIAELNATMQALTAAIKRDDQKALNSPAEPQA